MNIRSDWKRILYTVGVAAVIVGAIDPLEGSVVIAGGSALIVLSTWLMNDRYRKVFLLAFILIVVGVVLMFYFSSLGGFGGRSALSWWWALLMLPYPAGWALTIVYFIKRMGKKTKKEVRA